jgi:hypothetical protein
MHRKVWTLFSGLCGLLTAVAVATPAIAQEVKPKPPMYAYVANWQVPRDKWPELEKSSASAAGSMEKALTDGTLVGYGNDESLMHTSSGATHDTWWMASSLAGLMKVLEQVSGNGGNASSPGAVATKHWDNIYVTRDYNWKPGTFKGGYTHVSLYKFKGNAPDDALDQLCQHLIVPLMEKLIAEGTISEYEVDSEAIHSEDPNTFALVYLTQAPDGLDKVQTAIRDVVQAHPLAGQAFDSLTDDGGHRDFLMKGNGAYK